MNSGERERDRIEEILRPMLQTFKARAGIVAFTLKLETLKRRVSSTPLSLTLGEVGILLTRKTAPYRTFTLSSEVGVQSSCGSFADPTGYSMTAMCRN